MRTSPPQQVPPVDEPGRCDALQLGPVPLGERVGLARRHHEIGPPRAAPRPGRARGRGRRPRRRWRCRAPAGPPSRRWARRAPSRAVARSAPTARVACGRLGRRPERLPRARRRPRPGRPAARRARPGRARGARARRARRPPSASWSSRRFSSRSHDHEVGRERGDRLDVGVLGRRRRRRSGCSQNRVHATGSTPQARRVSVADGTRLTTRDEPVAVGHAAQTSVWTHVQHVDRGGRAAGTSAGGRPTGSTRWWTPPSRAPGQRLRRAHRAQRGPAGRRGGGHRLHVLRVEGPPRGRGVLAAARRPARARRSTAPRPPSTGCRPRSARSPASSPTSPSWPRRRPPRCWPATPT